MDWNPYDRNCPTRQLLDQIGDKWTVLTVKVLAGGPMRYTELRRSLEGISQKMLTQTLQALERQGIVERKVHPVVPPRVEYFLTPLGRSLDKPLAGLCAWSERHAAELDRASGISDRRSRNDET